jgi:hypothetical protein
MPTETVPPFVMRFDAGSVPVVAAIKATPPPGTAGQVLPVRDN